MARTATVAATAYAFFTATYLAVNAYSVGRPAATLYLPGETSVPFVPEFEFLYALGYILPVYAVFRIPTAMGVVQLLTAFLLTLGGAYVTYLVFPVYLERPVLVVDSIATYMLSLEYLDHSYNHFPSLHVALVWLGYLAARSGMRRPYVYAALAAGMSIAPVFIGQHYAVDLVAGAVLALAAWAFTVHVILPVRLSSAASEVSIP